MTSDYLAEAASLLESIPDDELTGLYSELSRTAADLEAPAGVRKCAAVFAHAIDTARTGFADWDALLATGAAVKRLKRGEE